MKKIHTSKFTNSGDIAILRVKVFIVILCMYIFPLLSKGWWWLFLCKSWWLASFMCDCRWLWQRLAALSVNVSCWACLCANLSGYQAFSSMVGDSCTLLTNGQPFTPSVDLGTCNVGWASVDGYSPPIEYAYGSCTLPTNI